MIVDVGSALSTYSQVAIGLAGFASILIALSGKPSSWTRIDSFRITNVLGSSFLAVLISMLPPTLALIGMSDPVLWKVCLTVLASATASIVVLALSFYHRLPRADRAVLRPRLVFMNCAILAASALVEAAAALHGGAPDPGVFFAGLVVLMYFSIYVVIRFLFARPTD